MFWIGPICLNWWKKLRIALERFILYSCLLGLTFPEPLRKPDWMLLDKMIIMNFKSAYTIAQPAFRQMMKQKREADWFSLEQDRLFNLKKQRTAVAYALSKSLLFRLAESINAESRGRNITAHVIIPSIIDTEVNRASQPEADYSNWVKPEELADVIYSIGKGAALRETVLKVYGNA